MGQPADLVGRERERAELLSALEAAAAGHGGVILVAGEAGVGKTRLVSEALVESGLLVLTGEASQEATPAYGPIVSVLRSYLRKRPDGLADCGPLTPHLGLLLPELGPPPEALDQPTLLEAVRRAFETAAGSQPLAVMLDDLQWADDATITGVLPVLAAALGDAPVLVIGVYRSDEIPRGHRLRVLRRDLRRAGRLRELAVPPWMRERLPPSLRRSLARSRPVASRRSSTTERREFRSSSRSSRPRSGRATVCDRDGVGSSSPAPPGSRCRTRSATRSC